MTEPRWLFLIPILAAAYLVANRIIGVWLTRRLAYLEAKCKADLARYPLERWLAESDHTDDW